MGHTKLKGTGICKLTVESGRYVKSHLIPRALTRLSRTGEKHVEAEIGHRPIKRPDSWYDSQLVIRKGEDILEEIDTAGIEALRKHKLIWSSWKTAADEESVKAGVGVKEVIFQKPEVLQLFFLSLAWRAAASELKGFKEIRLEQAILDDLRARVVNGVPGSFKDYPIVLFQIVTRGMAHNRTPILEETEWLLSDGASTRTIPYIRFYFDGLVAHVHLAKEVDLHVNSTRAVALGGQTPTLVFTFPFENSRAKTNLQEFVKLTG